MNKYLKVLIICIFMFPCLIKADTSTMNPGCDYKKEVELNKLASKISYEKVYNKERNTYTVTLYNVMSDLYLNYNGNVLNGGDDNTSVIEEIEEGTYMNIVVYSSSVSCYSSLMTLYITIPYYNPFYGGEECTPYEGILTVCSSEFLSYKINAQILKDAIDNYNNKIHNEPVPIRPKETTLISVIKNFISLWGMKIVLAAVSIGLSVWYFQIKLRKTKHGI